MRSMRRPRGSMVRVRCVLVVVVVAVAVASCGGADTDEPAKSPAPQKGADAATSRKLQEVLDFQRESYGATGIAAAIVIGGRSLCGGPWGPANPGRGDRRPQ